MTKHIAAEQLATIKSSARVDLTDNPAGIWLIFETAEQRAAARAALHGGWVTVDDRSVRLNYVNDWLDVDGYGLHVAFAPALCRTWQQTVNPGGAAKRAADLNEGDVFSADHGQTWHTFAWRGCSTAGAVACYLDPEAPRTGESPTYRVRVHPANPVAVRPARAAAA